MESMDEADQHQILQTLNQFIKSKLVVKKVTPLLISLSMFTFFFSYSFLLHSFNFNFSTSPFQKIFSYTTDKNCIFLLCNGILFFLARNSCLITSSPSGYDYNDHDFLKKNEDYNSSPSESLIWESKVLLLIDKGDVMEGNIVSQEIVVVEKRRENDEYLFQGGEEEIIKSIVVYEEAAVKEKNEEEEKEPAERVLYLEEDYYDGDDEEEGEEEEIESLSTEELNKKFDDFIRRMKEDIRIRSQQLLLEFKQ